MSDSHVVKISAPEGEFRLRAVFDLLTRMGLIACETCAVWKSPERYIVTNYVRDGGLTRSPVCDTCGAGDAK